MMCESVADCKKTTLLRKVCLVSGWGRLWTLEPTGKFELGSRSNLPKLQKALVEREITEVTESGIYLADPLFAYWFRHEMM